MTFRTLRNIVSRSCMPSIFSRTFDKPDLRPSCKKWQTKLDTIVSFSYVESLETNYRERA